MSVTAGEDGFNLSGRERCVYVMNYMLYGHDIPLSQKPDLGDAKLPPEVEVRLHCYDHHLVNFSRLPASRTKHTVFRYLTPSTIEAVLATSPLTCERTLLMTHLHLLPRNKTMIVQLKARL